jgi:hypothetical protein
MINVISLKVRILGSNLFLTRDEITLTIILFSGLIENRLIRNEIRNYFPRVG